MMRNDYRRALILLRGNVTGYSGHVRLERRTLTGSMYFQVQAPQDCPALHVSMAGRGKEGYYACDLGEMKRDARGQAVMTYSFDPRNICGRELEQYQLLIIACVQGDGCAVMLCGNINGHAQMDWERVRTTLCSLYANAAGNADEMSGTGNTAAAAQADADAGDIHGMNGEIMPAEICDAPDEKAADIQPPPLQFPPEEADGNSAEDAQDEFPADEQEYEQDERTDYFRREDESAAIDRLALDPDLPWPEDIEPLRSLFQNTPPMEQAPDTEYIYIAAPMPEESGYAYCAVGILAQDGMPVSVRYALPAMWSAEPPAGLEEYTWVGDGNRGWWVSEADA